MLKKVKKCNPVKIKIRTYKNEKLNKTKTIFKNMHGENALNIEETDKEKNSAYTAYDYHLLKGHFDEIDEIPTEQLNNLLLNADELFKKSKSKKNPEKILILIDSLKAYFSAFALKDKCAINNTEGLFSFICVRHPELELDWITLQRIISASETSKIDYTDQKTLELAITIYISTITNNLKKE